jgi:hypothetical protein
MPSKRKPTPKQRNVFVVHGRSLRASDAMFEFLKALGLNPMDWNKAIGGTQGTIVSNSNILASAFAKAQAFHRRRRRAASQAISTQERS